MAREQNNLHAGAGGDKGTRWQTLWPYLLLFLLALGLRLVYLAQIAEHPVTSILLGDAESYDTWAREIVAQGWIGERTFYQAPLYPYFLALIYTIGGHDLILVRIIQAVIGATSCLLLAGAGSRFFNRSSGLIAGALLAVYPPALFFDLLIQKAVLGMFFMCLLLFLLGQTSERENKPPRPVYWILIGIVLACFALVRENALILVPAIGLWMLTDLRRSGWRPILKQGVLLLLGMAIIFTPVTVRNLLVGGEFVLTTSQFGPNFYIGNNRKATGFYEPLIWDRSDWKFERTDAENLAETALGRELTPNEVSDYWLSKTLADIREAPAAWLQLMAKKWAMTWNAVEISDSESLYAHYHFAPMLGVLGTLLHFGTLLPLAVVGLVFCWPWRHAIRGLIWIWVCFAASVTLFFVFARYRHPMTANMLLFAGTGLSGLVTLLRDKRYLRIAISAALALVAAFLVNWPLISRDKMEAPTYFNIGYELEQRDELDAAKNYYLRSLALVETNTLAHNNLGMVAMKQNRPEDAIEQFRQAVAAKPDNWDARVNLGIVLAQRGDKAAAIAQYKTVLRNEPDYNPTLYYNIACYYAVSGQTAAGMDWLRQAIAHGYDNWELIQSDPDLDNLRKRPEFSTLLPP
ncbi:MAG: tetratricopeptide repeat protein [Desulfuromonadales bacterium]